MEEKSDKIIDEKKEDKMDEKKEEKKSSKKIIHHSKPKNNFTEKIRKNPWVLSTLVLGVVVLLLLFNVFSSPTTTKVVSQGKAGQAILAFANAQGANAELVGVNNSDSDGFYEVMLSIQGQTIPIYVTKDGEYFASNLVPLNVPTTPPVTPKSEDIPKVEKPAVELFVMSFCPYGVKAEQNILPVVNLLKDSIDFKIRYIVGVNGDTINDVNSLHGVLEAKQDAVQLIINEDYPDKFLTYIENFDEKCYQYSRDETNLDKCWKEEATKLGINAAKVETDAYGSRGLDLLKAEEAESSKYGVSGSPTLIINEVKSDSIYSGTSATQDAICSAFTTAPEVCGTQAEAPTDSNTVSGSC